MEYKKLKFYNEELINWIKYFASIRIFIIHTTQLEFLSYYIEQLNRTHNWIGLNKDQSLILAIL